MNLPELKDSRNYVGLYVIDFGDHTGVGFTAEEIAELLDSEKFKDCKVYKIHKAYPDGRIELKGIQKQTFQLEMGMFFYEADSNTAKADFDNLVRLAVQIAPPCKAKLHLAKCNDEKFVTAIIFPAEFNDEISTWLLDGDYKTKGPAEGGIEAVQRYYNDNPEIIERHQLFGKYKHESRTGRQLLKNLKLAVQR